MTTKKRKTPPQPRELRARGMRARVDSSVHTVIVDDELANNDRDTDEELIEGSDGERGDFDDGDKTLIGQTVAHPIVAESDADVAADIERASNTTDRRLTPTLLRIFARRRQEIGISVDQVARLSGISRAALERYEQDEPGQQITYDQVVVMARVLGLSPDALPGLRRRESRVPLDATLGDLERTLLAAPLLRFEGQHGERFGGDVERAAASKVFTVRVDDDSLLPAMQRGALLGFVSEAKPRAGGILLLRHRRSSLLTLRRFEPPIYAGLLPWQPSYPVGGEWHLCGTLEVMLPPR